MKNLSFIIVILCIGIFVFSCKSKEQSNKISSEREVTEGKSSNDNSRSEKKQPVKDVIIDQGFLPEGKNNRMNILSASLNRDILNLVISYSGGCKEHDFNLYYTGFFAKSLPPQIKLHLIDAQEEDVCRQLITDTLNFNIAKVKVQNTNKVILTINEYEERLEYIY